MIKQKKAMLIEVQGTTSLSVRNGVALIWFIKKVFPFYRERTAYYKDILIGDSFHGTTNIIDRFHFKSGTRELSKFQNRLKIVYFIFGPS